MKKLLSVFLWIPLSAFSQLQTRNDAGLQGNQGAVSGFFETSIPTNYPAGASSWWHMLDVRHSNPENNFAMQFAGSFFDQELYFRKTNNHAGQAWSKVLLEHNGNVGIGTTSPQSTLTIRSATTGVSINPGSSPYFGTLAFNRESATGAIFDPSGKAFQINNGGSDQNLHVQVYNGNGTMVTNDALVISGTNGNVGIGTASLSEKLSVEGKIRAREIKVEMTSWADFVFVDHYVLPPLDSLANYIKINKHLPGIPSTAEVLQNGIALGEMNKNLLQKVEELSLYVIHQNKIIKAHSADLKVQEEKNFLVKKEIELLREQMQRILKR